MSEIPNRPQTDNPEDWENYLKALGMGAELPEYPGEQVPLGDGLGRKTDNEERLEDKGKNGRGIDSTMCPINLGTGLYGEIDQPNDRPVEEIAMNGCVVVKPSQIFYGSSGSVKRK